MTRTTIHTSDGDTYYRSGAARTLITRALLGILIFAALIIAIAAGIGFSQAGNSNSPSPKEFSILHNAQKEMPNGNCRLEWNSIQKGHEVICDR
jgi:hypothetical protein